MITAVVWSDIQFILAYCRADPGLAKDWKYNGKCEPKTNSGVEDRAPGGGSQIFIQKGAKS